VSTEIVSGTDIVWIIIVTALITVFTRALPFIFFRNMKQPKFLRVIERDFPSMIMLLLVIYCLKDVSWSVVPFGIPEIVGIVIVAVLHLWKGNALLSIFTGTIVYMYLVQSGIITVLFT
jgi:branched-subunit amino acid transport protein AzlD